jgi:nitrite reductase (NO-forming)
MKIDRSRSPLVLGGALILIGLALNPWGCGQTQAPDSGERASWGLSPGERAQLRGEEVATLTPAPQVPPPLTRSHPTHVVVRLEVREQVGRLADGVEYTFWTFGGSVPGPFIRVRQNDVVEFHLSNHPDSKMPHNIDLHAVTGPGGGATSSFTAPGKSTQFTFTALNAGLFVYHCATAPVGMHIANGMYGLILVEPPGGLPPVDREYYIMQSEFYTAGAYGERGLQAFDMAKALREEPDYVVFNGAVGALAEERALRAERGETLRLFVGNGGPSLISSFHVIGEIFDLVHGEGGSLANQRDVQTTLVPAGGAAIAEFKVDVPGTFLLVDHAIFRAFNKGALGMLKVSGEEDATIYSGQQDEGIYMPEGGAVQAIVGNEPAAAPRTLSLAERVAEGRQVYEQNCAACHQLTGKGIPGAFPPLAGSDYLLADKARGIRAILHGLQGELVVNGQTYNGVMPALLLGDEEVASVMSYVLNSWGNAGGGVEPLQVREQRR